MKQIHYFYKITNLINKKFYYGIRSCNCLPGKDPYMGSGTYLHRAFRKYGIENFRKEILRVCKTREDAEDLEAWIVNKDLIINPMCYNIVRGGCKYNWYDSVIVKDKLGNHTIVNKDDPRYINGDLIPITKGDITVLDLYTGKYISIPHDEYINNKDRYKFILNDYAKNHVVIRNEDGTCSSITKEEYDSGNYYHNLKGYVNCMDITTGLIVSVKVEEYYNNKIKKDKYGKIVSGRYSRDYIHETSIKNNPNNKYKGFLTKPGSKCLFKDGEFRMFPKEDINDRLNDGWVYSKDAPKEFKCREFGRNDNSSKIGMKWYHNPDTKVRVQVFEKDINEYISRGFIKGYGPRRWS